MDWRSYDGPYSDIRDGDTTKPDPCYENRISILTRHLTLDDTSRIYRCFIIKDQEYSEFAAEFSVGTVTTSKPLSFASSRQVHKWLEKKNSNINETKQDLGFLLSN